MDSDEENGELSEDEYSVVETISQINQTGIDISEVKRLVVEKKKDPDGVFLKRLNPEKQSSEEISAIMIIRMRKYGSSEYDLQSDLASDTVSVVEMGTKIIHMNDDYQRFDPCIRKIVEVTESELETLYEYLRGFSGSEYSIRMQYQSRTLQDSLRNWDPKSTDPENAELALKIYQKLMVIFEHGFPNLLAMKRILDGEQPSNRVLQRKRASAVRRELTNIDKYQNSVYFDLIVNEFDNGLRNGIAHGDIFNDPINNIVKIPTNDKEYSYKQVNEIVSRNVSTKVFLEGVFEALVEWQYHTYDSGGINEEVVGSFGRRD